MTDPIQHLRALFVAAHAVTDTRLGLPFDRVTIMETPGWEEPDGPFQGISEREAGELRLRLAVGYAALVRRAETDASAAAEQADRDLRVLALVFEGLEGRRPAGADLLDRARAEAEPFLADAANGKAIELVDEQLRALGWLDMHEVDLLVEAADGDEEALDHLERYRATFSAERIPWPDHT